MTRKPLAIANWKMAMTVAESQAFLREFERRAGAWLDAVDAVICPPYTAIWAVAQTRSDLRIRLGAQNVAACTDPARTGQVSAALLIDAGCEWVELGHWEVRRYLGDDDETVRYKVRIALDAGLKPILFVGEAQDSTMPLKEVLEAQLGRVLNGCRTEEVASMAFVYEPEIAIGGAMPVTQEHVAAGCAILRGWLRAHYSSAVAECVRIVYGGSVAPGFVPQLLACPDVDGLAATRRSRDAAIFAELVRLIAERDTANW
jgi:triosephosphate isomerase